MDVTKLYWILFGVFFPFFVSAQANSVVKEFHAARPIKTLLNHQMASIAKSIELNLNDRYTLKKADIKNGDLIIEFDLGKFPKREKELILNLQPYLSRKNQEIIYAHPKFLDGGRQVNYDRKSRQLQIKWLDFTENVQTDLDDFILHLQGGLSGPEPVNCSRPPKFGLKQKLPHYLIAGLTAGAVVAAYNQEASSEDFYKQHRDAVFAGRPVSESDDLYNKSNLRNKSGAFLKTVGYSVFAANALVFTIRYFIYKDNLKAFQYYCSEEKDLRVQPVLDVSQGVGSIGLNLNYRF